jgi:hypothetical protein
MASVHKLSSRVIDYAERANAMADAAQGKRQHRGRMTRWLLLPASGAALYALVRSDGFSRQAKTVVDEAKNKASDLPEDLVARVRDAAKPSTAGRNGSSGSARSGATSKRRTTSSRRKSSSSRKTASSSR